MDYAAYTTADFDHSPLMFYFETTTACDLVCKHCRASAQEAADPAQLNTEQAKLLLAQIATFPKRPMVVLTGGDPLKRHDLMELIAHGRSVGLEMALTPSATPLATREAFQRVREAGIRRLGISLDGPNAATHDAFRGWSGSFERTREMLLTARELGMAVQINTTVCRRNVDLLDEMAQFLVPFDIAMWALFFLIPVGRGFDEERIKPEEYEVVFEKLYRWSQTMPYAIKTTEAPHYRRFVMQRGGDPLAGPRQHPPSPSGRRAAGEGMSDDAAQRRGHRAPLGVTDGKGIMFVSNIGEIFPAGFLPICCGRFPQDNVVEVYQKHPVFLDLRTPSRFKGKCGVCEYNTICGGSRSRAYGVTGDHLESEPDCLHIPEKLRELQPA
jgi:AdoMet-dependent heme synthase